MLTRRWVIFLSASMLYFVGYFHRASLTVVVEDLMREFSASATSIGFLSSLYFYPYAAMQIPAGLLIDSLGSKRTLSVFSLTTAIGTMLFAFSQHILLAMLGRALIGLGVSVAFLSAVKLIASWFDARDFASLTGILVSIGNVGALFAATPLALLVDGLGWRLSFAIIASATFVLTIILWLEVEDAPKQRSSSQSDFDQVRPSPKERMHPVMGVWRALRSRDFWPAALPPLFFCGSFISMQGLWGVPFTMQVYGISRIDASIAVMMMAVGFCLGAPFWGVISDRFVISRKKLYLLGVSFYSLVWLLVASFWFGKTSIYILFPFLGFFFGVVPMSIVMVKELFPRRIMGAATGSANAFPFIGAALYQLLMGYFLDTYGLVGMVEGVRIFSRDSYQIGFMLCFVTFLAAMVMAFLIKEPRKSDALQS